MSRWILRAAMTSVFVSNGLAVGAWAASLPMLREQLGLSDAQLGVVLLALAGGAAVAMPASGALAARRGAGWAIIVAAAPLAVLFPLPALMPDGTALLAASVGLGMALGSMDVGMNARGAEIEQGWGAAIMSSFHAGWSLGGLLGASFVGLMAVCGVGLVATLAGAAVLILLLALPCVLLRAPPPARIRSTGRRFALPSRAMLAVSALAGLCFVSEASVMDWSGVYLRSELGASVAASASGFAGFSAAMVVGRLLGDVVVRRFGPPSVVRVSGLTAAAGLAIGLVSPFPIVSVAGFALVGLGLSNVVPVTISAASWRGGPAGVAMAATFGYGGLMGGPPIIGLVADAAGLRAALCLVLLCLLGIVLLGSAAARRPVAMAATIIS
jgi:MFS family permease